MLKAVRKLTQVSGLLALITVPLSGQEPGTLEFGGFGRYTKFDSDRRFADAFGGGGRMGVFLHQRFSLEGDLSYTTTDGPALTPSVSYIAAHGRVVYRHPLASSVSVLLGAGYSHNEYGKNLDEDDDGVGGLVGLRLNLGRGIAVRVEATGDYALTYDPTKFIHLGGQAGLSAFLPSLRPADSDKDGVPNKADTCPGTPAGEAVDANGCSASQRDTDRDAVRDNVDRCPNTPAGERVDSAGCSDSQRDSDRDGVRDNADRCPNTPTGEPVDASGCSASQKDSDNDGVKDNVDKCPNTPRGETADANGCSDSQRDADGDGVTDTNDKCPGTPAGEAVDASGCAASQRDSDGDGVKDSADLCPNSAPGARVDANGCTAPALFEPGRSSLVLKGVNFQTGSAILLPQSRAVLDTVAASLQENLEVRVEVQGHTDNTGTRVTNVRLSQARADAVKSYLVGKGIAADRLEAKGYGPDQPAESNATSAGRAQNRRVELKKL